MIVHEPTLGRHNDKLRLRAQIEYDKPAGKYPAVLWFDLEPCLEPFLTERMDGWAVALLLVAMRRGEPLTLRGTLSDALAHGIEEYQRAVSHLDPRAVKHVPVCAADYARAAETPNGVGMTFSGGVDSFFTLWSHLAPREPSPAFQVTHAIFVEGADIGYGDEYTMEACRRAYGAMFRELGLEYWTLRSNIRDLYPDADWGGWMCNPFLASVGLLFGKAFRRFYFAAGSTYWDWTYGNKRFLFDNYFCTETMHVSKHGLGSARVEKIQAIAHWQPVRETLRVCYAAPNGLMNCGRCPKCVHTMLCLELAGELQNVKTFDRPYTRALMRSKTFPQNVCAIINDTRRYALAHGQREVAVDLSYVIAKSLLLDSPHLLRHLTPKHRTRG